MDPTKEELRLLELYGLHTIYDEPDAVLDAFCEKVAKLFDVPTCVVSLVLEDRQWFKSSYGCPVDLAQTRETPRNISFCTHVVDTAKPLIVREVPKDPRFANNPLVKRYGFGFYAGFPLTTSRGAILGSLCLYDTKSRLFSEREIQLLGLFSERVMAHLEMRRELGKSRSAEAKFSGILDIAYEAIISVDESQKIIIFNKGAEQMFGYSALEAVGKPLDILMPDRFRGPHHEHVKTFSRSDATTRLMGDRREIMGKRKSGEEFAAEASISRLEVEGRKIFTAVMRDITDRKRMEEAIEWVATGTSSAISDHFFQMLVRNLAGALKVRWAFVSKIVNRNLTRAHIIAMWNGKGCVEFEYQTAGTPCEWVIGKETVYYPYKVQEKFPKDSWLRDNGVESYLAIPLFNVDGSPLGHLGVMHDAPMMDDLPSQSILKIFAARAGAELERKRTEETLLSIAHGVSSATGDAFFRSLVHQLAEGLGVEYAMMGELTIENDRIVETIAVWTKGRIGENFRYNLAGTPCDNVVGRTLCTYPSGVREIFPDDAILREMNVDSYAGVPLFDSAGRALGLLVVMDSHPLSNMRMTESMLKIFAMRAAGELERKHAEEALAEQAVRDTLTNLYNRRYFNSRLEEELRRADRSEQPLVVLLCDLDRFKLINDTQGHQRGDEVLKSVAKGIQDSTRGSDMVFRWGGDEVVVVLPEADRQGVMVAADRIQKSVRRTGDEIGVQLDLSIGVALFPEHGRTVDELMRLADRALYIAKQGGDKIHIGEEEYSLSEETINVVFQPVVDLDRRELIGYEALSRDAQGKLSILELFKRFHAIGQLNELKYLCFMSQIKEAKQVGLKRVFINVDFTLLDQLELIAKPSGIDVILEISEVEALHDVENHLEVASKWREAGYKFAIDDFGAGFISLPFIARVLPDYIKMDRSTVLQAVGSDKFRKFSRDLVRALNNYTSEGIIAEGIETEKELHVVKEMGINLGQGYLLGRPQALG